MTEPGSGAGSARRPARAGARIEAVIFDWGGTLTPVARGGPHRRRGTPTPACTTPGMPPASLAARAVRRGDPALAGPAHAAPGQHGRRAPGPGAARLRDRPGQRAAPGGAGRLPASSGTRTPTPTPTPCRCMAALRERGIRVGVLSNTLWPRAHHEAVFARDGLLDLIDGAVYSSELPVGKPHEDAFVAALRAVGVDRPGAARCSSATGPGTTCTAPSRSGCARSSCRTATSRTTSAGRSRGPRRRGAPPDRGPGPRGPVERPRRPVALSRRPGRLRRVAAATALRSPVPRAAATRELDRRLGLLRAAALDRGSAATSRRSRRGRRAATAPSRRGCSARDDRGPAGS